MSVAAKIDFFSKFKSGHDYEGFLAEHGTPADVDRWNLQLEATVLTDDQKSLLGSFRREMNVLCMAGAWCGDCVDQCPVIRRIELECPELHVRFVDRDADPELAGELKICGGSRVPQMVILSEEGKPIARLGDRMLSRYRQLAKSLPEYSERYSKNSGNVRDQVLQDWMNEFERAQLILRLSPSLRAKHGD